MVTWLGVLALAAVLAGVGRVLDSIPLMRRAMRPWNWRSRRAVEVFVATVVVGIVAVTAWYVHRETTFAHQAFAAVWVGGWASFLALPRAFRALRRWDRRHARA